MDTTLETRLRNISARSGKSVDQLVALVRRSGHTTHGAARDFLKTTLGMGHGDANVIVHRAFASATAFQPAAAGDPADAFYVGPKTALRPIHDAIMTAVSAFGAFEIAPKKTYLSLRRKKQFATVGPATNTKVEVGLNMKGIKATGRLDALRPGGMCQYRVRVSTVDEVNAELVRWIRTAFDASA